MFDYVKLPRAVLIQSGAVLILLVWLMGAILQNERKIVRTPFDLPLLGFVSWASLSLLWAHNFSLGFETGIQWGACLILFFLTTNLSRSERDIRQLLGVLLLAGTLVAVLGICQYLLEVTWVPQIVPPASTFANRNMAAQFMVVTIPLAVGFFLLSRKRNHILLPKPTPFTKCSLPICSVFRQRRIRTLRLSPGGTVARTGWASSTLTGATSSDV